MTKRVAGLPAAGGLTSLLVVLALCGPLPGAWTHVCDGLDAGTMVCDPDSNGTKYYVCVAPVPFLMSCGLGLVFNNDVGYCDWPSNAPACVPPNPSHTSTTTTPTTTTPTTSTTTITTTTPTTTTTTTTPTTTTTTPTTTTTTTTTPPATPKPTTPPRASTTSTTTRTTEPTTTTTKATAGGSGNPCAGVPPYTRMCDPETNGTSFLMCVTGKAFRYQCPQNTFFRQETGNCDWRDNIEVMCVAGNTVPTRPATTARTTTTTTMAPLPSGTCNPTTCQLPDCRCISADIPGHLAVADVPQMVLLTFDDGINDNNNSVSAYDQLFLGRGPDPLNLSNPNLCPTAATFFVSNDYNNMSRVRALWEKGHEMASHSQTHGNPRYWDSNRWQVEMQGMREKLAQALGVSVSEIQGLRTPFLELGKETQFSMMQHKGFTYDSSMFGGSLNLATVSRPVWPFTLDYPANSSVCAQSHCPERSYPGVWEVPLIRQYGLGGVPCSMTDSCPLPVGASADDVRLFLLENFARHYESNRAPFMISLHATWFRNVPGSLQGLKAFLREVQGYPDVWQVSVSQMLDWVRHPVPRDRLHELLSWKACA